MEEQLTSEEAQALKEMESDTGEETTEQTTEADGQKADEGTDPAAAAESEEQAEPDSEGGEEDPQPEFKSNRDKPPEGYVPHGALHAEREKRKALEQQIADLQEWKKSQEKPAEEAPQYVDPIEDPEGFRKWAEYNQGQTREQIEAEQKQRQEEQAARQRVERAQQLEQQFAEKTPDYQDAVQWLSQQRVSELRGMGYGDEEVAQQIRKDANGIFDAAEAAGMNPAEILYYRAKSAGFEAKPSQEQQQQERRQQEEQKMQAQATAQQQTQGLGSGGGASQGNGYTAEQLASMSETDFAKLSEEDIRQAMGG